MLKQTTPRWLRTVLAMLAVVLPLSGFAQSLTQADFTGVVVPQYTSSGTAARVPVLYRATVSNLTPNTLYRYYTQAGISTDLGTTATGAGNPLLITLGATPAATTYAYTSTASLSSTTAGNHATFRTNANGAYTGWFGFLNTGNARFTAGNTLYMTIALATDMTPTVVEKRLALDQTLKVLALGTGTTANDASGLKGNSSATPKNLVAVYDNVGGTGRPLGMTVVEAIAATGAIVTNLPTYYTTGAGDWNTLIPNVLPNGVRRVEQFSVVDGSVVGCASDADGVWPSGANTVSPVLGTTAVALTATDAALNTSACGMAATASVTATPTMLTAFSTPVGTASASQTIAVGGTTLTANVVVMAPAGYEVSLVAASGYAASVIVAQTAGTAANTPVYVRLTGTTVGSYAGNVTVASTGATAANVVVSGTVNSVTNPTPTITSFAPASGSVGTTVTVIGTNFTGATGATLNGVAVTNFMVMSATSAMFTVPIGATTGAIVVTALGGTATSATNFTVTVLLTPTITILSPARAVVGGPDFVLTVDGTKLTATTQVSFRGQNYTAATVNTAGTSITVDIPASAIATLGTFTVTATNGGTASGTLDFSVVGAPTTAIFEDFEQGTRTSYPAASVVTLRSGTWTFTQALIGDLFNDRVNQAKAARIRGGGSIAMNFDKPNGAGTVTISAATYGSDTGATFTAEVSTDGGISYRVITGTPTSLTSMLTPVALTVNRTGNVRLRFRSTNTMVGQNPRINLDDLIITDYTVSATLPGKALPGLTVFPNPTTDRLTVVLSTAGAATVALRDLIGRLVLAPATLAADQQLRLPASLAVGVYLLEVSQGSIMAVRRIEKN